MESNNSKPKVTSLQDATKACRFCGGKVSAYRKKAGRDSWGLTYWTWVPGYHLPCMLKIYLPKQIQEKSPMWEFIKEKTKEGWQGGTYTIQFHGNTETEPEGGAT